VWASPFRQSGPSSCSRDGDGDNGQKTRRGARRPPIAHRNFSASGERLQDNNLLVIHDSVAAKFDAHFERMWDAGQPTNEFEPAVKALEPKQG
jgi:hypothetical protein